MVSGPLYMGASRGGHGYVLRLGCKLGVPWVWLRCVIWLGVYAGLCLL